MDGLIQHYILYFTRAIVPVGIVLALLSPRSMSLPTPTPTPTPTATSTPTPPATPTFTPTSTPTPKPTLTPTPTPIISGPKNSPTPTQTPTPPPPPATGSQLDTWFTAYSNRYSIDRQKLWNVAVCESNLNANAVNGPYGGMYQFSSSTWNSTRRAMNLDPNPDLRFNPEEAIKTAAFKISTTGLSSWPNCGK